MNDAIVVPSLSVFPTAILLKPKRWQSLTIEITITIPDELSSQASAKGVAAEAYVDQLPDRFAAASEARNQGREQLRDELQADWERYQSTGLHLDGDEVDGWLAGLEEGEAAETPSLHI
jgi:hypothetical protein